MRAFSFANITAVLFSIPFAGALLANILWMQQVWGYSAIKTGFAVSPGPLMVPIFAAVGHRLTARIPVGVVIAAGCALFGLGGLLISLSISSTPAYATALLPGWLIGGVGVGLALPAILSSATADLPATQSATGSAVVNMSRQIGMALGVSVLVAIIGSPVATTPYMRSSSTHGGHWPWSRQRVRSRIRDDASPGWLRGVAGRDIREIFPSRAVTRRRTSRPPTPMR